MDNFYLHKKLSAREYQYAVVQFLQRPREDIGEFVCIPHSWIRIRRVTEEQSIVAYPNERPSVTQRRIEDGEKPSEKWNLYMTVVKRETYTYKDAHDYVLEKKYGVAADDLCLSVRRNGGNSSIKRPQHPESQLDTIINKLRIVESTNGGSFFQDKISYAAKNTSGNILPTNNQAFTYPYIQKISNYVCETPDYSPEIDDCETNVRETSHISRDFLISMKQHLLKSQQSTDKNQVINTPNQNIQISKDLEVHQDNSQILHTDKVSNEQSSAAEQCKSPQLLFDHKRSLDSGIQPMIVDESKIGPLNNAPITEITTEMSSVQYDDNNSDRSNSPGVNTEEADQLVDYPMKRVHTQANFISYLLEMMETSYLNSSERILEVHESFEWSIKLMELLKKRYDSTKLNENIEKQDEVKEVETPDVEMRKDDGNVKSSSNGNYDQDDSEDEDKKALKKTHDRLRNFVLPPEYDLKDTRWTLKYRESDPKLSLVELIPGSNVFVNSIKLAHCKRVSKDCKTLARMLLAEIFSHSALTVCSLTGARANAFHNNGTYVRPGLDANARETMLAFVEEYAREKQWATFDKQSVINSVRSRIQEIRSKHARTE